METHGNHAEIARKSSIHPNGSIFDKNAVRRTDIFRWARAEEMDCAQIAERHGNARKSQGVLTLP